MNKYLIQVEGCDASTEFVMELTDEELQLLLKVAHICNKTSTYGCMPRIWVFDKFVISDCSDDNYVSYEHELPINVNDNLDWWAWYFKYKKE